MRGRLALLCACLLACSSAETRDARETYDYLVTPAGQRFRVIGYGPVLRGANTHMGLRITYVARSFDKSALVADADALVAALGPELELSGETALTVRARLGGPSLALDSVKSTYDLEYRLVDGRFQRAASDKPGPAGSMPKVPDDPAFPFKSAQLNAAAAASSKWLPLLEGNDLTAIRAGVTKPFAKALSNDAEFRALLAQRRAARLPGARKELYRLQQRVTQKQRPPGADALVVYECRVGGVRILERLSLASYEDEWKIASYAFQPIP